MIRFIDTNIYVDNTNINVIVYSDYIEKSKKKIDALVLGEYVLDLKETSREYRAIVLKDNIRIFIKSIPLSAISRGHRSHYSIVDRDIVGHSHGQEIFYGQILPQTVFHSNLFKEPENAKLNEIQNIMLF